jgi:hypothetical protein
MAHLALAPVPEFVPVLMASLAMAPAAYLVLESPPQLFKPSILRI